jgi:hypothetical protein
MNKICLRQVKGVMGMMWVGKYDQFAFWNLRSLDIIILSLYFNFFCKFLDGTSNATKIAQIDEGSSKICLFQVKGVICMM